MRYPDLVKRVWRGGLKPVIETVVNRKSLHNVLITIWVPEPAKLWLQDWLKPDMIGVEFGSGCSTLWLGMRTWSLISVEHDARWFSRVKRLLQDHEVEGVDLIYSPSPERYTSVLDWIPDGVLDFVYSDGPDYSRTPVLIAAYPKIRCGGVLIADDTKYSHSTRGRRWLETQNASKLVFRGTKTDPWTHRVSRNEETTIWLKS